MLQANSVKYFDGCQPFAPDRLADCPAFIPPRDSRRIDLAITELRIGPETIVRLPQEAAVHIVAFEIVDIVVAHGADVVGEAYAVAVVVVARIEGAGVAAVEDPVVVGIDDPATHAEGAPVADLVPQHDAGDGRGRPVRAPPSRFPPAAPAAAGGAPTMRASMPA